MPEGDTIATYAQRIAPLLVGRPIRDAECRWPAAVLDLVGRTVVRVRAVGKHLLLDLSDGSAIRVHLGLHGTWHRYVPGERWRGSRANLALRLVVEGHELICFGAPTVERVPRGAQAPAVSALGPDLMDEEVDLDEIVTRALARGGPLGEVLLDQRVAAGIGNVFKSELAFVFRLDPFGEIGVIEVETLRAVYARGGDWLRANVGRIRNTTGLGPGRPDLWVYGRAGRPCLRCGTRIASRVTGPDLPRVTYGCPRCQGRALW